MAQVPINALNGTATNFTITIASLASSTAGVGRQSTLVNNTTSLYFSAQVNINIKVGTTPTLNSLIYVYLLRSDNGGTPIADDNAGTTDAGITIINATQIGSLQVNATTSNANYMKTIDTSPAGELGPLWGIAIVNSSGVTLNASQVSQTWIGKEAQVG